MLYADVEALVNPVNTVGVMGKGLALRFRNRFPANFRAYAAACASGEVQAGRVFVFQMPFPASPRWIVNLPTKRDWRADSLLGDIEAGLDDLKRVITELEIRSIAIPALGCGLGGLEWSEVEPLIVDRFSKGTVKVVLFGPQQDNPSPGAP